MYILYVCIYILYFIILYYIILHYIISFVRVFETWRNKGQPAWSYPSGKLLLLGSLRPLSILKPHRLRSQPLKLLLVVAHVQYYPLVNIQKTMENHHFLMGKLTISMAMFNSYVTNYQRVNFLPKARQDDPSRFKVVPCEISQSQRHVPP